MDLARRIYEAVTGRPWTTVRSCAQEFGPPPGAVYRDQLAAYSDAELIAYGRDHILAEIRAAKAQPTELTRAVSLDRFQHPFVPVGQEGARR